ncbi:hypothetical protein GUITHDRAFT_151968 [Guillardia theta CCMP2712]|uniref:Protein RER1 n=1 Tax=Guillardia theta (strain CCMP2712) TaxID=905079 RepID=L1JI98_GUITC|nr:hypothetical protein GUITHDRAFT_151968 [Guillardia theta CCMP2712]EKX47800.1 hypothetical protein GUITHDRAFT_151968 [Guillardia theta CCMP2712]|mmetsp:Transcript_48496/g.152076  ORF Transcript_48496/g.152076 Transcript_48496/m.152076 type:complete len:192 (-) Transcript_48496:49-624(-)|eukprot:XP_005834780.1 hypothetical protein GUITHDRAFT_151968 [Guillardia theta CCMP2712]
MSFPATGGPHDFSDDGGLEESSPLQKQMHQLYMRFTTLKDSTAPHTGARWIGTAVLFIIYCIRIFLINGWYIVTYGLGIYILNLGIGFLSPASDPSADGSVLPTNEADEFKPFVRKLPEFKFWYGVTRGIVIAFFMTFFSVFNIPVFWPILVCYFFALFIMTMRRQIQHMIKHNYIPITLGKPKFKGKDST